MCRKHLRKRGKRQCSENREEIPSEMDTACDRTTDSKVSLNRCWCQYAIKSSMFTKGAKEGKRTRKARNKERTQFLMQKIIQRVNSLTFLVIRKAGNRNRKSRISLREIWVITKYTRSEYTQLEEDSQKYLLVYEKVVPALVISIFIAQTKVESNQPTLPMANVACLQH